MLSNAYFLAKFRFDTAENEPAKNLQNFAKFANFADPNPLTRGLRPLLVHQEGRLAEPHARGAGRVHDRRATGRPSGTSGTSGNGMFGKMMLVFGCIGTDFCK